MVKQSENRKSKQSKPKKSQAGKQEDEPKQTGREAGNADESVGGQGGRDGGQSAAPPREERAADEQLLRLRADFENYKRRVLREKDELYRRASEDLMTELLPVLDHLEMALQSAGDRADDPFVQGVRLVGDQLMAALGKYGLAPINAEGEAFDPNLHEAVSCLPSPDTAENHVMVQTRRGYRLGERLLRAAQVVVSSGVPAEVAAAETE